MGGNLSSGSKVSRQQNCTRTRPLLFIDLTLLSTAYDAFKGLAGLKMSSLSFSSSPEKSTLSHRLVRTYVCVCVCRKKNPKNISIDLNRWTWKKPCLEINKTGDVDSLSMRLSTRLDSHQFPSIQIVAFEVKCFHLRYRRFLATNHDCSTLETTNSNHHLI